ncbi:hypothetical protein LWP59_15785 [Amycolatopsis acidiphila]|uniref:Uncharacterized protein n=1 Tax=Amycolatopsis acidiphila TaxID=715473 RepID=A0A558A9I9_9PSEU|nr:hypothetical protein [Amycolatopsis acidiphila]TVT20922.1 hypothetical protein FNH06_18940 [Amycolatopsis acidiphila]UIJ62978.1 hypothetical protein LWP59_15785 [Amycolatopsis acidiphila]GHG65413.1 hypothetical protein GCM10017788_22880 [Amycolatopsis acidiphila]
MSFVAFDWPGMQQWLRGKVVAGWMNILILLAAGAAVVVAGFLANRGWPVAREWGPGALKLFVLWCLSFLPGWLYVRFLYVRAHAVWTEYVLTLHRLGWDRSEHLPEPARNSSYHGQWEQGGRKQDDIYRQKFEAYYGRIRTEGQDRPTISTESLFPVFLFTTLLAVGWAAILWDTTFLTTPSGVWDVLKYGFIGSYAFVTGMLVRRFFQTDLRPSAYTSAILRIVLVLLIVAVVHQVVGAITSAAVTAEVALAFLIGFFPLAGLQLVQRATARAFGTVVPPLKPEYPLDQLDGLNLWYETRLLEEGVEDMQNLTSMNLVDVILHTKVPPGRVIDWLDQAFLLTHLDSTNRKELRSAQVGTPAADSAALSGPQARVALRRAGIRTATDLLKAFSHDGTFAVPAGVRPPLPESQLRLLVLVLSQEAKLSVIWNWQRNDRRAY